jgi:hypothetical protein
MSILDSNKMTKYKVVGSAFLNDNGTSRQEIISHLTKASKIKLVREPNNFYDKNAIAVYANDKQVGYLSAAYAEVFAPKIDGGNWFNVSVDEIGHKTVKGKDNWYMTINIKGRF